MMCIVCYQRATNVLLIRKTFYALSERATDKIYKNIESYIF